MYRPFPNDMPRWDAHAPERLKLHRPHTARHSAGGALAPRLGRRGHSPNDRTSVSEHVESGPETNFLSGNHSKAQTARNLQIRPVADSPLSFLRFWTAPGNDRHRLASRRHIFLDEADNLWNQRDLVIRDRLNAISRDRVKQANEPSGAAFAVQLPGVPGVTRVVVVLTHSRHAKERGIVRPIPLHKWLLRDHSCLRTRWKHESRDLWHSRFDGAL